jgi:hypothetical protein
MTGNTAGISHICEFGWYDWVMFRNNVPSFPDNAMTLGRYLGRRFCPNRKDSQIQRHFYMSFDFPSPY